MVVFSKKCEHLARYIKDKMVYPDLVKQIEIPLNEVMVTEKFTFLDLFSGIGGFRIALKNLGGKCLGFSEIDKQAIKVMSW
ncbi:MAG: DNA cytosine methyltransferase [Microcystaceae cyanobacterium]